jgi:hypothetical protein
MPSPSSSWLRVMNVWRAQYRCSEGRPSASQSAWNVLVVVLALRGWPFLHPRVEGVM